MLLSMRSGPEPDVDDLDIVPKRDTKLKEIVKRVIVKSRNNHKISWTRLMVDDESAQPDIYPA